MKSRLFIRLLVKSRQTGESIDTREGRQEFEPFGQSIRTTPPLEEEPPANPVPIIGDSLFPEWQCALPTELIPTHCALKMIADIKGGGLWLGPTSTKNKEGNAGSVSMQWAVKLPNKKIGWADDMPRMSRALSSSTKESDDEKDANNTLKGNRIFASVEVRASDEPYEEVIGNLDVSFIPNFVDASQSSSVASDEPTGDCTFSIDINTNGNVGIFGSSAVLDAAKAEITRIFGNAGFGVAFGPSNAPPSEAYSITLNPGRDGRESIAKGTKGSGSGALLVGELATMAMRSSFNGRGMEGYSIVGSGVAIGRVTAHEAIIHNFLDMDNDGHTPDGVTSSPFSAYSLFKANSTAFEIPTTLVSQLGRRCIETVERPVGSKSRYPDM